jgi:hypothetical protein
MRAPLLFAALLSLAGACRAIVIYGVDPAVYSQSPGTGSGWDHVGSLNGATGVYLGSFGGVPWALTATHVGPGTLTLGGVPYQAVPGAAVVIRNPDGSPTDLTAFQLATMPDLPPLNLASTSPSASTIMMIGNGATQSGSLRSWTLVPSDNSYTWQPSSSAEATLSGYSLGSSAKRWGWAAYAGTSTFAVNGNSQRGIFTEFIPVSQSSQAAAGDSGGAVFSLEGNSWSLVGIISAVTLLPGQPGDAVATRLTEGPGLHPVFTAAVSIPEYRTALLAAIPEPGHYALGAGTLSLLAVLWHRRRQSGR